MHRYFPEIKTTDYGRARAALACRIYAEGLTIAQVAQELGTLIDRFPAEREPLQAEAAALDRARYWSDVDLSRLISTPDDVPAAGPAVVITRTERIGQAQLRVVRVNPRAYYGSDEAKERYVEARRGR